MQVGLRLWVQIINGQPRITSEQVPWRTERVLQTREATDLV